MKQLLACGLCSAAAVANLAIYAETGHVVNYVFGVVCVLAGVTIGIQED